VSGAGSIAVVATVDELLQATDDVPTDGNSKFRPDTHAVTCRTTEDKPSTTQRQCLELETSQSEVGDSAGTLVAGRSRWVSAAEAVDDPDAVEADHDRQPPRHRRGLEPSDLLQPAHIPLDVGADCREWFQVLLVAPAEEDPEVGVGVEAGLAAVAAQVGGDRRPQHELIRRCDSGVGNGEGGHI
jgi:hypothetical protein